MFRVGEQIIWICQYSNFISCGSKTALNWKYEPICDWLHIQSGGGDDHNAEPSDVESAIMLHKRCVLEKYICMNAI